MNYNIIEHKVEITNKCVKNNKTYKGIKTITQQKLFEK